MQNFQWEMMAQFIFPAQLGIVEEVISVDIKPRWQEVETEESVRLEGIYHIMAVVRFNPNETPRFSEGTFIEHIEFDGNNGYFEYALPFEVDLPREKVELTKHPQINIEDLSFFIFDGSSCLFKWDACCVLNEQAEDSDSLFDGTIGGTEQLNFENHNIDELELLESIQNTPTELFQQISNEQPVEVQDEYPSFDSVPVEEEQDYLLDNPIKIDEQIELDTNFKEQDETINYLESIHLPTFGELVEQEAEPTESINAEVEQQERIVEAQPVIEKQERIVEAQPVVEKQEQNVLSVESEQEVEVESNTYLPTDTDDFYNQLTESYTVLKLSNNIIRE